jgi:hypothetical protein
MLAGGLPCVLGIESEAYSSSLKIFKKLPFYSSGTSMATAIVLTSFNAAHDLRTTTVIWCGGDRGMSPNKGMIFKIKFKS